MSCPNCNVLFNINDKDSYHQVNDLTGLTYCTPECSEQHMFKPEALPLLKQGLLQSADPTKEELVSLIETESFESDETKISILADKILNELAG